MPQDVLKKLLSRVYDGTSDKPAESDDFLGKQKQIVDLVKIFTEIYLFHLKGIGLDSAIVPIKNKNLYLVSSTDFFYPLLDDAKLMGESKQFQISSDLIVDSFLQEKLLSLMSLVIFMLAAL